MISIHRSLVSCASRRRSVFPHFPALLTVAAMVLPGTVCAQMSVGANLWRVDWGSASGGAQPEYNYFASGVNWTTTTNPWNPTFISELQQANIKCLRFMDWGPTNGNQVVTWNQRISRTANHYNSGNTQPLDNGTGCGVAYEWMIDLCNRAGADMWVCVPHKADTNYAYQLACLTRDSLDSGLKVYVEYSNEVWNDGFSQTGWLDAQRNINGLANPLRWQGRNIYGFGSGGDCRWSECVYFTCRTMNQFNRAFGTNSPRVVKVLAGQLGWGDGTGYNQMCEYHMACLGTTICNPWGVKIDAYAGAPYYSGASESAMRTSLADNVRYLQNTLNALVGSGLPLVCYEGGTDNFSTQSIANDPFQYQLTIDALNAFAGKVQGIFNWYTFNGGAVWGLKQKVGDDPSISPKWRGYMQWVTQNPQAPASSVPRATPALLSGAAMSCNLLGRRLDLSADTRGPVLCGQGVIIEAPGNRAGNTLRIR
jgi:hypothetical protein